jgi:predicted ATP-grasp superfamily ATP-dependent carboligase
MRASSPRVSPRRSVLLLGNYRPTLTVARALARDGFNVVLGLGHDPEGSAQYSRHVHEIWDHPRLTSAGQPFGAALRAFLAERPDIRIVYPVSEDMVRWIAEHAQDLPRELVVATPPAPVVQACLDKLYMAECALAERVPCQPFAAVRTPHQLRAAAGRLGYPVVVRSLNHLLRLGRKKAIIASSHAELAEALTVWPKGHDHLLVQKRASGERRDVYFAAQDGRALRCLEVRILRTDSLDGTGLSVDGEIIAPTPSLTEYVSRLLRRLDYTGIGCAQFLVDTTTGDISFLEINPRIAGSHRCTEIAGMDLTRFAIRLAARTVFPDRVEPFLYAPGWRYCWTYGDLGGLKNGLAAGEIGIVQAVVWLARAARSLALADVHLTFDRRDPTPSIRLLAAKVPGLGRLMQGLARRRCRRVASIPGTSSAGVSRLSIRAR